MKERFQFEVGQAERHYVDFSFDRRWGPVRIWVDDKLVITDFMMFSFDLIKRYEFVVGQDERHTVAIEKKRKQWFAGLRPSTYTVSVDGQPLFIRQGDGTRPRPRPDNGKRAA
jgi:hypothetical protein